MSFEGITEHELKQEYQEICDAGYHVYDLIEKLNRHFSDVEIFPAIQEKLDCNEETAELFFDLWFQLQAEKRSNKKSRIAPASF